MFRSIKLIWLLWAFDTTISSALGLTLGERLIVSSGDPLLRVPALLVTSGLFIGVGQWMILRTRFTKAGGWILATVIGLTFGFLVGLWVLDQLSGNLLAVEMWVIVGSMLTGTLQWYALQKKMSGSLKWILTSVLSWGIAINLTAFIFETYFTALSLGVLYFPVFGILIGAFVGIISGAFVETSILETR